MQENATLNKIWQLITPSWFSGLFAGVLSMAVVVAVIIVSQYQSSALRQELFEAHQVSTASSTFGFKTVTDNLAHNSIVNNAPLFLFWAGIGVIVYFFAVSIMGALSSAVEMEQELEYVNAPRERLIKSAAIKTIVRLLILGVWLVYLQVFLRILLPYVLGAAHVAATSSRAVGMLYAMLAVAILFLSLQMHVTLFRLVFLRTRVFGSSLEA
jgi:hypothetical protein